MQEDIDDTTFIDHPLVPPGTTLGSLKGTPDYEMGKGLITAFTEATNCSSDSNFGLATYDWLSASDSATPVSCHLFQCRKFQCSMFNILIRFLSIPLLLSKSFIDLCNQHCDEFPRIC